MAKLSEAQCRVLTTLTEGGWWTWRAAGIRNIKTLSRLEAMDLIEASFGEVRITVAGRTTLKEQDDG